jgi:hypothetical protein
VCIDGGSGRLPGKELLGGGGEADERDVDRGTPYRLSSSASHENGTVRISIARHSGG